MRSLSLAASTTMPTERHKWRRALSFRAAGPESWRGLSRHVLSCMTLPLMRQHGQVVTLGPMADTHSLARPVNIGGAQIGVANQQTVGTRTSRLGHSMLSIVEAKLYRKP